MPRTLAATLSMLKLLTNTQEFVEQFWIILLELIANCFPAGRCCDVISLDHGLLLRIGEQNVNIAAGKLFEFVIGLAQLRHDPGTNRHQSELVGSGIIRHPQAERAARNSHTSPCAGE